MNVTEKQKIILLKYMKEHEDFARGRLPYNSENKKKLDDMWLTISNSLNAAANGPRKMPKEWQKTWRDWKGNVLKKCATNKSYAGGTGGGPPKVIQLTNIEENLLEIIDLESAGLENIPEGGNFERPTRDISLRNKIPEGGSFDRLSSAGSSKRTADGYPKGLAGHPIDNKRIRPSVAPSNQMPRARNFSCEPAASLIGSRFDELDDSYELGVMAEVQPVYFYWQTYLLYASNMKTNVQYLLEEESTSILNENIPGVPVNTGVHDIQNKEPSNHNDRSARTQSNARTAIDLMREKMELLAEQVAYTKQYQDRMIQIEEAKLTTAEKNLKLNKEIAECLKNIHGDFDIVLRNVDNNVTRLREDVEKIAPSYLE